MTTGPFTRPTIAAPAPCWFVRQPPKEDAIEIVFVGHANRAELDAQIERLARWAWPLEEDGRVTILGDSRADPIGIRLEHVKDAGDLVRLTIDILGGAVVAEAHHNEWRARARLRKD